MRPGTTSTTTGSPGSDLLRVAPVLVVEVTSPSTRGEDLGRKLRAWADGGAPWYWVVDLPFAVDLDLDALLA